MSVKRDSGSDAVIPTECVVHLPCFVSTHKYNINEDTCSSVLIADRKVGARLKALIVRDFAHVPSRKAARVAIIAARDITSTSIVEVSMKVKLLTRVVLVDGLATSLDIVHAVLNRVNSTGGGILSHTYGVSKAPSEQESVSRVLVCRVSDIADVESLDC